MITQKRLKKLLYFDPEIGFFIWLIPSKRVKVGCVAGSLTHEGYVRIGIGSEQYQAHRLAWLYVTGEWPIDEIDHINGARDDNAWANLREASRSMNSQNQRRSCSTNKLGVLGVTAFRKKYRATIGVNGKQIWLGLHATPAKASAAYIKAKRIYHPGCTL